MAMMAKMRSLAPAFIITVGALFVLFMVLSDSKLLEVFGARSNDVGSINGTKISYLQYQAKIEELTQKYKEAGQEITDDQQVMLEDQVWNMIVDQEIFSQQADKLGVTLSADELKRFIVSNPPQYMQMIFRDSATQQYNAQLAYQYYDQLKSHQQYGPLVAKDELFYAPFALREKLKGIVTGSVVVSESEVRKTFSETSQQINVEFALVELSKFNDNQVTVNDDDLKKYYDEHQYKFKVKNTRQLKYVLFSTAPTKADSVFALKDVTETFDIIKNDTTDFSTLVSNYSSEKSVVKDTVPATSIPFVSGVLDSSAVNKIIRPVAVPGGYAIYKYYGSVAKETGKNYVVQRIFIPIKASSATLENARSKAKDFAVTAIDNGFEKEAEGMKYKVMETPPFQKEGGMLGEIGNSMYLVSWAYNNDLDDITENPFRVQGGYVIAKVTNISDEGVEPFEKVKDQIKPFVLREKKFVLAKAEIEKVKSGLNGSISNAPNVSGLAVADTTGMFTLAYQNVPKVGRDFTFMSNAMKLELNKISEPIKGLRGYYIMKVVSRSPFDEKTYEAQRQQIIQQLTQQKKEATFNAWYAELKKNSDIVDQRYKYRN